MNKYFHYSILAGLLILLNSCCQDLQCPPFNETERNNWLPQETGSALIFEQPTDHSQIHFMANNKHVSEAYKEEAGSGFMICKAKDCETSANIRFSTSDTAVVKINICSLSVAGYFMEDEELQRDLSYQIGDFKGSFKTYPQLSMYHTEANENMERDSIVNNLTLGNRLYNTVVIQTRNPADTSKEYIVQKVYVAQGFGIVGFVSLGKPYYLK